MANAVVTTIDSLPVVPGFMKVQAISGYILRVFIDFNHQLVGTSYSLWFAYRNLLFESSRKELGEDLDVRIFVVYQILVGELLSP